MAAWVGAVTSAMLASFACIITVAGHAPVAGFQGAHIHGPSSGNRAGPAMMRRNSRSQQQLMDFDSDTYVITDERGRNYPDRTAAVHLHSHPLAPDWTGPEADESFLLEQVADRSE